MWQLLPTRKRIEEMKQENEITWVVARVCGDRKVFTGRPPPSGSNHLDLPTYEPGPQLGVCVHVRLLSPPF